MLFNFIKSKNRKDIKKEKNKGIFKRFLIPIKKLKILKFFLKKKKILNIIIIKKKKRMLIVIIVKLTINNIN